MKQPVKKMTHLLIIKENMDGRKKRIRTRDRGEKTKDKLAGCVREPAGIA